MLTAHREGLGRILTERPKKWTKCRTKYLQGRSSAREYWIRGRWSTHAQVLRHCYTRIVSVESDKDKKRGGRLAFFFQKFEVPGRMDVVALVVYYARTGYWRHVQTVADQVIKKRGRAPVLTFWRAYGVARESEYAAAIREFDSLRQNRAVEYPAILALLWAHERTDLTDHEAVDELQFGQAPSSRHVGSAAASSLVHVAHW